MKDKANRCLRCGAPVSTTGVYFPESTEGRLQKQSEGTGCETIQCEGQEQLGLDATGLVQAGEM